MQASKLLIFLLTVYLLINFFLLLFQSSSPHTIYLQNDFYTANPSNSSLIDYLNDTSIIPFAPSNQILGKASSFICKSIKTSYTEQELTKFFNFKSYSNCTSNPDDSISFFNYTLQGKCKTKSIMYATDYYNKEIYAGDQKDKAKWEFDIPDYSKKQFLFVKCSEQSIFAFVFLWYNELKSKTQMKLAEELGSYNKTMSVLILALDSVSRFSFQRNLKMTAEFLKNLELDKTFSDYYEVFEFDKVAVPHARTIPNIAQMIYGKSRKEVESAIGKKLPKLTFESPEHQKFQKNAIWHHFSSLGYMTLFTHETSWDHVSPIIGRKVETDHVFENFFRYTYGTFNVHAISENERCVGGRDLHEYLLDYTYQFYEKYPNNHKFGFAMTSAAHEKTGNVKKLDKDCIKFISDYLKLSMQRNEDVAFFFISDHGYKDIAKGQFDKRSFYEYYTPMTYFILSKGLIDRLGARSYLKYNQNQLISRYDMHLSLHQLAYTPYSVNNNFNYQNMKKNYKSKKVLSLFKENAGFDRTCADFEIENEFCLCSGFEPALSNGLDMVAASKILILLDEYFKVSTCSVKDLIREKKLFKFTMKTYDYGLDTIYHMKILSILGNLIEIEANLCLKKRISQTKNIIKNNPFLNFKYEKSSYFLQLGRIDVPDFCRNEICYC